MFLKQATRYFHSTRMTLAAAATSDKSSLAALRKKTGYTFSNCKKALELNNNDIKKAEEWLKRQAQELGWSKATKLEGRATAQGLVGVLIKNNIGAMVEVNCETDFVAKNDKFKEFVDRASKLCARYTEMTDFDGHLWKLGFETDALRNLKLEDGKTLSDHLALLIGTVGENAVIKRAICFKTNHELKLYGFAHPSSSNSPTQGKTQFGKYGTIAAFRTGIELSEELQKNLCQHIVGMNPKKIGEIGKDEPATEKDEENCLIYQEYLLDPNVIVDEILKENGVEIIDFQRYECGETENREQTILEELKLSS